ncbi:SpaA isopeptide-forming pilin-related protein [Companilactobacillus sp.]|uniref:SpaA isopeptide-forming pilin-related protein n=1 Tax=Companilactobacillus sp. TaxID=2767905 RepID=UPI00262190B0|nr:SpaA isopeptide-forming pilin-related protein [Companilactobacillus sp.]
MKITKKIISIAIAIFGLFILVTTAKSNTACAATNYTSSDMITSGSIIDQDKTYSMNSTVGIQYEYDTTGLDLQNGDTLTIDVPEPLKVSNPGETFNITDDAGNTIGTAVLNSNNQIVVTFTDVENIHDVKGSLTVNSGVTVDRNKAEVGSQNVEFPIKDGQVQDSNLTTKLSTNEGNISKKGVLGKDENGDAVVTWTILANRNELNLNNLNVSDTITDPNLEYIPGSVIVYEASWKDRDSGTYSRDKVVSSGNYTLNEHSNGFDLTIPKAQDQMYAIKFQTKLTDDSQASDGTVFRNDASMDATLAGNGSGGSAIEDSASAKVVGKDNSGNGSGNVLGGVLLTKEDESSNEVLPGAVYSLYKVGSDTPIKAGLTTDENGQINVGSLAAGDYYFKETQAPEGYQPNDNEVPFTITGQTTTPVQVTAKDEPKAEELGSVVIEKIDSETGYKLAGAEFDVVNSDGEVVGHITTDRLGIGHLYNLPIGEYTLKETKAPDGYMLGNDISFSITANNLTPALISIENEKIIGIDGDYSAFLQKFDTDRPQIGVPGAEYTLYDENGDVVTTALTNEYGVLRVDNLKPGKYYFQETTAPNGFDINPEKISFEITDSDVSLGQLTTSDSETETGGEIPDPDPEPTPNPDPDPDPNPTPDPDPEPTPDPDPEPGTDVDGNGGNEGSTSVDPDPGNNGGLITDPSTSISDNNSSDPASVVDPDNSVLPQTGNDDNALLMMIGFVMLLLLSGLAYDVKIKH